VYTLDTTTNTGTHSSGFGYSAITRKLTMNGPDYWTDAVANDASLLDAESPTTYDIPITASYGGEALDPVLTSTM
jgi:hypothetical protein